MRGYLTIKKHTSHSFKEPELIPLNKSSNSEISQLTGNYQH
jgi:hypothetical protein